MRRHKKRSEAYQGRCHLNLTHPGSQTVMGHVDRIPMFFPGNEPLEARQKCPEKKSLEGGSRCQPVPEPSAHFPMGFKRLDGEKVGF